MTRRRQKDIEQWILERFLESLGEAAPGLPSSFLADESPDFLMGNSAPYLLGLEIVELHHLHTQASGLLLRQAEGIHEHLCRTVEQRWDTATIPVAEVSLHLLGHQLPQKHEEPKIADEILAIVRANMPQKENASKVPPENLWQHPILDRLVESLTIARWGGLDRPYVTAPIAAFLPPLSYDLLQAAFDTKNGKTEQYRMRCQEVWLVAAYNNSALSTHFSPHDSNVSDPFDLAFDRTFVFDVIKKKNS